MSTEPVNYESVLADLEAKKAQIEAAITAIRALAGLAPSTAPSTPPGAISGPEALTGDTFLSLSIPEAAKKYLMLVKRKQSTQDIMRALEAGGLPPSKYATVYGVLRRREAQVGDIINFKGDWALAEWYPNYSFKKSAKTPAQNGLDSKENNVENQGEK